MICPSCDTPDGSRVVDSRPSGNVIRRRRECVNCGERFTTKEYITGDPDFDAMTEVENILVKIRDECGSALIRTRAIVQGR